MLGTGLMRSKAALGLLVCALGVGVLVFSVLMWIFERGVWDSSKQCYARHGEVFFNGCSPFESVPVGFWWAITTMTTVGYGDAFPVTPLGRVIGGIAMLAGIFCVALPTGILCTEFSKLYEERANVCKETKLTSELQMRPKAELELILDSEKLASCRNDLDDQLTYLKRLAYIYVEASNEARREEATQGRRGSITPRNAPPVDEEELKLDPMYSTFQNQTIVALDAMRSFVTTISDELTRVPVHAGAIARRRGSMTPSPRTDSP